MIKNIIFDFGGVIFTDDDIGVLVDNFEVRNKFSVNQNILEQVWDKYWNEIGENRMTILEFYNNFQKEISGKVDVEFSKEMFEIYKKRTHILEAYNLLSKLKERYKLFALTNIFKEGYEFKKEKYRLNDFFEHIVASCDEQTSKPGSKIFEILLNRTSIKPDESLFVDDREKNINTAHKLGFVTHLYTDLENLKLKFNELDITLYGETSTS